MEFEVRHTTNTGRAWLQAIRVQNAVIEEDENACDGATAMKTTESALAEEFLRKRNDSTKGELF